MSDAPVDLLGTIGRTPLVPLTRLFADGGGPRLWAKLESFNPGGSAKDRSAHAIVAAAWARGAIGPGSVLVESSSGNYAVALARVALLYGVRVVAVVDPRANPATVAMVRALGAEVVCVTEPDAETGDWLAARLARVRELVATIPGAVWLDQYSNTDAVRAHSAGTMAEIVDAVGAPDVVLVATSTTGTIAGCLDLVARRGLRTRVVAVDAEGSVLFGGRRGARLLSGYGAGVVTALSQGLTPNAVCRVSDLDAVVAARALARREGVLAGASSGAVVAALARLRPELGADARVVLVLHDGGLPYADTVFDDAWVAETFRIGVHELAALVESFGGVT